MKFKVSMFFIHFGTMGFKSGPGLPTEGLKTANMDPKNGPRQTT